MFSGIYFLMLTSTATNRVTRVLWNGVMPMVVYKRREVLL